MTSEEIKAALIDNETPNAARDVVFFLREIAYQLATFNEREVKKNTGKRNGVKVPTESASLMRKTSGKKLFYVGAPWNTTVETNILPTFTPHEGSKVLDDLAVGEETKGILGTLPDATVTRKQ